MPAPPTSPRKRKNSAAHQALFASALTKHAADITLRQDAFEASLAHDKHGPDLALAGGFDYG